MALALSCWVSIAQPDLLVQFDCWSHGEFAGFIVGCVFGTIAVIAFVIVATHRCETKKKRRLDIAADGQRSYLTQQLVNNAYDPYAVSDEDGPKTTNQPLIEGLSGQPWLHPKMSNPDASAMLQGNSDGYFMIRVHNADSSQYVVSVVFRGKPTHHLCVAPDGAVSTVNKKPTGARGTTTPTLPFALSFPASARCRPMCRS